MWAFPGTSPPLRTTGIACVLAASASLAGADRRAEPSRQPAEQDASSPVLLLRTTQVAFYSGRYLDAAAGALAVREVEPDNLTAYELRSSALLFQLKHALALPVSGDKRVAFKRCTSCPEWTAELLRETAQGQALARKRLSANPTDETALFFLAKLDLNVVWLQLDMLGRRKGWNEYWEARKTLDFLLKRNPQHVRGRVARAWIDYIVDTRPPRGVRWLLGGGDRRRALITLRETAGMDAEFFDRTEATFALWDMEVREQHLAEALEVARRLIQDFPDNRDLVRFLAAQDVLVRTDSVPPREDRPPASRSVPSGK